MFTNSFQAVSPHFQVGSRFSLPVKKIVPFGCFFELSPGFDALLHVSKIPNGDLSTFSVGQVVRTRVCFVDQLGRVQLALDSGISPPSSDVDFKAWQQAHPVQDAAAVAWLRNVAEKAPLHATLLVELRNRFGVPSPIGAWVRLHRDVFANFGPRNQFSIHPCCGLVSKLGDSGYWRNPIRTIPPMVSAGKSAASPHFSQGLPRTTSEYAHETVSSQTPTLLLDGSNLIRTLSGGGRALGALLQVLDHAGWRFNVLFDANIKHVLDERQDVAGMQILSNCNRITIVPAGTPADDYLLLLADRKGYAVVSNDRFEQYRDRYAWLAARVESTDRRLHTVAEIGDDLVAPTLGLVIHVS